MRLIEIICSIPQQLLNATNLMGLMQGLPTEEMGYTPMVKGTKEVVRVTQASQRFDTEIVRSLQRYAQDQLQFYSRCKRASILYDWISGRSLEDIERDFSTTQYFGRIEYGDIRRFADIARFHLQSASNILAVLLLEMNPQTEIDTLLKQLEVGLPSSAIELLRIPFSFTRGEYLALTAKGILNPTQLWAATPNIRKECIGKIRANQLEQYMPKKND
jgi:helicase